jgi:hypothetical protein
VVSATRRKFKIVGNLGAGDAPPGGWLFTFNFQATLLEQKVLALRAKYLQSKSTKMRVKRRKLLERAQSDLLAHHLSHDP